MTVLEVIRKSAEFLEKKGIESSRLHAELLLGHVLETPRLRLYLEFERALTEAQMERMRDLIKRRGQGHPLQHLVGTVSFCGHEIAVGPEALIPRPETELLAEMAWTWLKEVPKAEPLFLDFGVGTGCVGIALGKEVPHARGYGVDISDAALALARRNVEKLAVRLELFRSDGFAELPPGLQFDLIVTNPPYIASAEIGTLSVEVRDHDPRLALDGGEDGLDFYRRLAAEGPAWMAAGGTLMAEFGDGQEEAIAEIFRARDWVVEAIRPDYTARPRIIIAKVKQAAARIPPHG